MQGAKLSEVGEKRNQAFADSDQASDRVRTAAVNHEYYHKKVYLTFSTLSPAIILTGTAFSVIAVPLQRSFHVHASNSIPSQPIPHGIGFES